MTTLETVLLILLVLDALALGALILLQQGKGADVGAAFGSGSANTVFGSAGTTSFLAKLTAWLAIGFFLISFALAYTAKERAAALGNIGMPSVPAEAPAEPRAPAGDVPRSSELTGDGEGVDSDIPKVPDV